MTACNSLLPRWPLGDGRFPSKASALQISISQAFRILKIENYKNRTIDLVETFNYLIGLRVKHIDMQQEKGFFTVIGWLPTGEKTLVLWRDCEKIGYDELWSEQDLSGKERAQSILGKLNFNPRDSEFDVVYINGDHNIPAVFTSLDTEGGITKTLKIRQIELEFLSLMFAGEGM